MGILIFKGMKVGIQDGDFTMSVDEHGEAKNKIILSTSYNVLPLWLRIANDNMEQSHLAKQAITNEWCEDPEKQKALLIAELTPSIQVFVACGAALDAIYDQMKPFANISKSDIDSWKKNTTSRSSQIVEIIRRVYKLDNNMTKAFKKNITSIMKLRDQAVHPTHKIKQTCTRPDLPVGVDWIFAAYRFSNAAICYTRTMEIFIHLYEKKSKEHDANIIMNDIFEALKELKLITEKT